MLKIRGFVTGPLFNNAYLIWETESYLCAIIDAPIGSEVILKDISSLKLSPIYLFNTHCHFDHTFNNALFVRELEVKLVYHRNDELFLLHQEESAMGFGLPTPEHSPRADVYCNEGDVFDLGGEELKIMETPGHSPGSVTIVTSLGAFVGDVLFRNGIGRYDLPGANPRNLYDSIVNKLFKLPMDTRILPGHGEETTIGEERRNNPFISILEDDAR